MTETQIEIVRRAKSGDPEGFRQLVDVWRRRTLGTVTRLIGRPDDAEDVAQEVFVRIYLSLDKLREPGQFEPWLYRIMTNAAMDYLRRHRRVRVRLSDLSEEQLVLAERNIAMREAAEDVRRRQLAERANRVLNVAKPEDRTLLVLKEVEGLSIRELSHVLGVSEEAVKVRLFRARQRVLNKLAAQTDARSRRATPIHIPAPAMA